MNLQTYANMQIRIINICTRVKDVCLSCTNVSISSDYDLIFKLSATVNGIFGLFWIPFLYLSYWIKGSFLRWDLWLLLR